MKVQDIMTTGPITVPLDMPVLDARQLMVKHRIRHLLVTDGRRLMGIVTDRDIRLNLPSPATSLSVWEVNYLLARLTVESVMTGSVIIVEPERDAIEAARIMLEHKIGALPVVDAGAMVGIVTETDVLRAFVAMAASPTAALAGR
jgi:CBS domain-containing protein